MQKALELSKFSGVGTVTKKQSRQEEKVDKREIEVVLHKERSYEVVDKTWKLFQLAFFSKQVIELLLVQLGYSVGGIADEHQRGGLCRRVLKPGLILVLCCEIQL